MGVDCAYASMQFRIPAAYDEPEQLLICLGPAPHVPNGALVAEIEEHTWHVSVAEWFGHNRLKTSFIA
jgi:hypothetical protein